MSSNRIRRYERMWRPAQAASMPNAPSGFVAYSLDHLSAECRRAITAKHALYQLAYDRAVAEADAKFVHDWII